MNKKVSSTVISSIGESLPTAVMGVLAPFTTATPQLAAPLAIAGAMYGAALVYKQKDFNKQIQFILDNPDVFTKKLMNSKEFSDALVIHFDSYLKMRGDKRLEKARNIFYDFAISKNKPIYPLERYDDTLLKISDAGIRFLGFVESEVPKIKEKYMWEEAKRVGAIMTTEHKIAEFRKGYIDNKPLSYFIKTIYVRKVAKQIMDKYHKNGKLWMTKIIDNINEEISLVISELVQLGLVEKGVTQSTGAWGSIGGESYYYLTHYGKMFTTVIKPDPEHDLVNKNDTEHVSL